MARRFINDGYLPDPDSVRVEEFINYLPHSYEPPSAGAFAIHMEGAPSRFGTERHTLLRIGLQDQEIDDTERQDASLIFVVDVSGSMENRLGLVKQSLRLLVDELRPTDEVGIVVYGSEARVILQPTSAANREVILTAIDELYSSGSTYAEAGLRLAYQMAEQMRERAQGERIVRLVLCSDGVANVGNTGPAAGSIANTGRRGQGVIGAKRLKESAGKTDRRQRRRGKECPALSCGGEGISERCDS